MLKIMIFAIVGAFISSSALAGEWGGSGCSGIQQSVATAPIDTFGDIADDNGTDAYPEDDQA
jgi:hypothetical protein